MSKANDYETYIQRRENKAQEQMGRYFINQEQRYIKPFKIYGNLYYVGDDWVCAHIVDTGDGLLLFDAGNIGATPMLIQAIWEAGFNPADVRWLVLSHAHVDHIGAAPYFQRMYGTKILLGAPDALMIQQRPEYTFMQDALDAEFEPFPIDVAIQDGDILNFGHTQIQFYLVPGHTEGCIACFFNVSDGAESLRVGYFGGFGFNTLQKDFLLEYGDPSFSMRQKYLASLQKVRNEHVDIFMANHTVNIDLLNKREALLTGIKGNPFIDSTAWANYLDFKRDGLLKLMDDPNQN